ncbi:HIT domain-containing protein [Candidatus Babeliales bacterium]|nr:HIT domain-containing protein [Candidatus Babeliales bacterium]
MDKLYAPWRDRYVKSQIGGHKDGACVFCVLFDGQEPDDKRYILYRDSDIAVILNLYPYNGGHIMVIPVQHRQELYDIDQRVQHKMIQATSMSTKILKQALACDGLNMGANIGRNSGAGIPEHLHIHVVPRFAGDTGFFTTIADSKQISVDLHELYKKLKPYFENIAF